MSPCLLQCTHNPQQHTSFNTYTRTTTSPCLPFQQQQQLWLPPPLRGSSSSRCSFSPRNKSLANTSHQQHQLEDQHPWLPSPRPPPTRTYKFFVTCSPGLEHVVAAELLSPPIAASHVEIGHAGVAFSGSLATAYNANLWLRCAIRVLMQLASGPLPRGGRHDPVYDFVRAAVDWPSVLVGDSSEARRKIPLDGRLNEGTRARRWNFRTFAVQSRVWNCPDVNNSMYASVRAKDAICDAIRDACGGNKPEPPEDGGATSDVPLFFFLYKDNAVLYRDMSGMSLHRRGYRDAMHRASLNESVAAAMLTIAGWNQQVPGFGNHNKNTILQARLRGDSQGAVLLDPMCGSGTLLIEAAFMATNRAPGLMRSHWPFWSWHDFDADVWEDCQNKAMAAKFDLPPGFRLLGNEIHQGAFSLCIKDARSAGVLHLLELSCNDCQNYVPPSVPSLVAVNPPWGTRLSESRDEDVSSTWQALGLFLKQQCNCADVYVLCGNSSMTRALHMKADKKWPVTYGGIDCRLLHYHVLPPKSGYYLHTSSHEAAEKCKGEREQVAF